MSLNLTLCGWLGRPPPMHGRQCLLFVGHCRPRLTCAVFAEMSDVLVVSQQATHPPRRPRAARNTWQRRFPHPIQYEQWYLCRRRIVFSCISDSAVWPTCWSARGRGAGVRGGVGGYGRPTSDG